MTIFLGALTTGAFYPIDSFPRWLKLFATVHPEAYAVPALKAIAVLGFRRTV